LLIVKTTPSGFAGVAPLANAPGAAISAKKPAIVMRKSIEIPPLAGIRPTGRWAHASTRAHEGATREPARKFPSLPGAPEHRSAVRGAWFGRESRGEAERRERFETLALPLAPVLRAAARRAVGRAEFADDLVQETYLRAYRSFDAFVPGTNERAWLFTILYSVCANHRRYEHVRRTESIDDLEARASRALALADPTAERAVEAGATLAWRGTESERALRTLPEPFRAAVELVDLAELSYEEAAAIVGCPVGTLRSRLFRGRRVLASMLVDRARELGLQASRGRRDA
jgi:RNA polymerase sigma-70 factor (ECF subfamily)